MRKSIYILLLITVISACNNPQKTEQKSAATPKNQVIKPTDTADVTAEKLTTTWIDDFKSFRDAAYYHDVNKLKTYFNFPVNTDSSQVFIGIVGTDKDEDKALQEAKFFTEADFKRYHKKLFHPAFVKSLLKIKSADLLKTGESSSPEFSDKDGDYKMHVTYSKERHTLTFDLAYFNGKDLNGDYVSEGEYNLIYEFDVIDEKYIRFKKVDMAG